MDCVSAGGLAAGIFRFAASVFGISGIFRLALF